MSEPKIQRRVVELDTSNQLKLFASPAPEATQACAGNSGTVRFIDPDPQAIFIGGTRLDGHLRTVGTRDPFVVRELLAEQDYTPFERAYEPGGRSPYAPRAMLGVILYGLMHGLSSLRELERLARVDVGCWWVSGGIMPDHSILGRFIQRHAEQLSAALFTELTRSVLRRTGSGTSRVAGDGTVIEAAASRYRLLKAEAAREAAAHTAQAVQAALEDRRLAGRAAQAQEVLETLEARQAARQARGKDPATVRVSPTEPEAVVQPQKNRKLHAPSYKPSVLANEMRVILGQTVDASSETAVVGALLDQTQRLGEVREALFDAGYHVASVIEEGERREIELLCPEGRSEGEQWLRRSSKQFPKSRFRYDPATDSYECPHGARLTVISRYAGNEQHRGYVEYATGACAECPLRAQCTDSPRGRRIKRYPQDAAKEAMRRALEEPQNRKRYAQRKAMVEPVFSQLRLRQGLNRFRRRGLAAVRIEFALHAMAYNLSRAVALGCLSLVRALLQALREHTSRYVRVIGHHGFDRHLSVLANPFAV